MSDFLLELERMKKRQLAVDDRQDGVKQIRLGSSSTHTAGPRQNNAAKDTKSSQSKKPFWVKDPAAIKAASGAPNASKAASNSKGGTDRKETTESKSDSLHSGSQGGTHLNSSAQSNVKPTSEEESIPIMRVKRLLRQMGEPITLFGETDSERIHRLKQLQIKKHEIAHSATGQKNIMDDIKQQIESDLRRSAETAHGDEGDNGAYGHSSSSSSSTSAADLEGGSLTADGSNSGTSDDAVNRRRRLERAKEAEEAKRFETDLPRSEFSSSSNYIRFCLKRWLWLWNSSLKRRNLAAASEAAGRQASELYAQAVENLKPMMKELKENTIEADIVEMLEKIVKLTQEREYVKANEEYLMLSVGDSPWPIGVTMVGIHERSSREKISSAKVAHILNDEKKRKYIQALKRVMNFCQSAFPTVPSKMFVQT